MKLLPMTEADCTEICGGRVSNRMMLVRKHGTYSVNIRYNIFCLLTCRSATRVMMNALAQTQLKNKLEV